MNLILGLKLKKLLEKYFALWPKKGNVKEILSAKLQCKEKKEMRNISTKVGLVPTQEHSTHLKMSILIKLTKLIKLAMRGC